MEAAEVIGANKQLSLELKESNRHIYKLHELLGEKESRTLDSDTTGGNVDNNKQQSYQGKQFSVVAGTPAPSTLLNRKPVREKLADFPPLGTPKTVNKSKSKRHKDRINKAKSQPVKPKLVIKGSSDTDGIWKAVKAKLPAPKIDAMKKLSNGDFLVSVSDKTTAKIIRELEGVNGLNILESGPRKPKVKIKGVPVEYTAEFITESVINQNKDTLAASPTDIRPLYKCGKRNQETVDWVLEVSPSTYKAILNRRTFIGMVSVFPRPFYTALHCRRCLALDHKTANCSGDVRCYHCAKEGHEKSSCPNLKGPLVCAHCRGAHNTFSRECSKWSLRISAVQRATAYDNE